MSHSSLEMCFVRRLAWKILLIVHRIRCLIRSLQGKMYDDDRLEKYEKEEAEK